jgi:hypothetical protein
MDFTNSITPNLEAFINRYPQLVEEAIASANQQIRNAKTRVNSSKARMIKARIQPDFDATPEKMSKEQLAYHKNCVEHAEAINRHRDIHNWAPKYLKFLMAPENDYIRHDLDKEYAEWTCLEDAIYNINEVYLEYLMENIEYPCNCSAGSDNYQYGLYFGTIPSRHIYIDSKGKCSHGTNMTLGDKDYLLNQLDFIGTKNVDILQLEVF